MNRNKKMQIIAIIWLFAITFSIVSTALLVIFSANQASQKVDLSNFIQNNSGTLSVDTMTWSTTVTTSWSTN